MTAAAIRLDPDTCILEGKACNASDNGGPSLEEKLETEREIDEQHKAKEEADAAKAGAGSESEEPSKGKPEELRDQLENGDTKVTEEIRANDVAKKEEAAAAVTEAKVAAEVLTTEPEINMPDVAEVVVEEVLNVAGEG